MTKMRALYHVIPVDWPSARIRLPLCNTGFEHMYPARGTHAVLKEAPALNTPKENSEARTTEIIRIAQP